MFNLTTQALDIVAAILDKTLPQNVTVHELAISPPVLWEECCGKSSGSGLVWLVRVGRTYRPPPDPCRVVVKSVLLANLSLTTAGI